MNDNDMASAQADSAFLGEMREEREAQIEAQLDSENDRKQDEISITHYKNV